MVGGAFGGGTFQPKFAGGAFTCSGGGPSVGPADVMFGAGADPAGLSGGGAFSCGGGLAGGGVLRSGGGALRSGHPLLPLPPLPLWPPGGAFTWPLGNGTGANLTSGVSTGGGCFACGLSSNTTTTRMFGAARGGRKTGGAFFGTGRCGPQRTGGAAFGVMADPA